MFDEADIYLPATSRPPTKTPLESVLERTRSAGMSVMLAAQSPGDLDYKCRENVRNWFVGLVKEPRAIDKLRPLLSDAKLDASAVLPKQKVGQFFMLSETTAVPLDADRNLVLTLVQTSSMAARNVRARIRSVPRTWPVGLGFMRSPSFCRSDAREPAVRAVARVSLDGPRSRAP
jgi:hypothetical protein